MKNLSNIGFDKYCVCPSGKIYSLRSGKFLIPVVQKTGYCQVTLSQDGVKKGFLVHRLIAEALIPNPENKPTVNHEDGNKQNNSVNNLTWMTYQENTHHAYITGLAAGTRNPDRSLPDETVHKICQLLADSWRNKDIAASCGVDPQIVANIRHRQDYYDISCEYDFVNVLPSRRKLCTLKLIRVCELLELNKNYSEIRKETGVPSSTISRIKNRKAGVYISNNYEF